MTHEDIANLAKNEIKIKKMIDKAGEPVKNLKKKENKEDKEIMKDMKKTTKADAGEAKSADKYKDKFDGAYGDFD